MVLGSVLTPVLEDWACWVVRMPEDWAAAAVVLGEAALAWPEAPVLEAEEAPSPLLARWFL